MNPELSKAIRLLNDLRMMLLVSPGAPKDPEFLLKVFATLNCAEANIQIAIELMEDADVHQPRISRA